MTTLKVWLFQYRDPDIRLMSQIDIVMCFIYNYISNVMAISRAMSLRYRYNIRMSTGVLCKKVFLEISQNSEENTCARDPCTGVLLWILWNFLFYRTPLDDCFSIYYLVWDNTGILIVSETKLYSFFPTCQFSIHGFRNITILDNLTNTIKFRNKSTILTNKTWRLPILIFSELSGSEYNNLRLLAEHLRTKITS